MTSAAQQRDGQGGQEAGRRRNRRGWLWAAAAVVAAGAVAGGVLAAQPSKKKSAATPSACWGGLTPDGLAGVVSGPGVTVSMREAAGGWSSGGSGAARDCVLEWRDSAQRVFKAGVGLDQGQYGNDLAAVSTPQGKAVEGPAQTLELGSGLRGFVTGAAADLSIPCTPPSAAAPAAGEGPARLFVAVGSPTGTASQSREQRQLYVDAALKLAKAAVSQVPCRNAVTLPSSVPVRS